MRWTPEQLADWRDKRKHWRQVATQCPAAASSATKLPGIKVRTRRQAVRASGVEQLLLHIRGAGLPVPELEYRFHDERKWRADFAWPAQKVLAEFEGGIWTAGAHIRGAHYQSDCEKYNAAALLGYRVFRFSIGMVESGVALQTLEQALRP